MKDQNKTKPTQAGNGPMAVGQQLVSELAELRQRIAELETSETERKRAVEASRRSEEKFKNVYAESPIGIELYDSSGQLLDANKACLDIFGVSDVAEVKGFQLFEDPNVSEETKERLLQGDTVRYEVPFDFGKVRELELYETARSGIIYLDVLITPLGLKEKGPAEGYLVQVQDITERKRAEEELREYRDHLEKLVQERTAALGRVNDELTREIAEREQAEEQMRHQAELVENVSDAIISTDLSFNIKSWNKAAETIYGWRADEAIGRPVVDVTKLKYPDDNQDEVVRQFFEEGHWEGETWQETKDGTPITIYSRVTLIRDDEGNPGATVAVNRDITERKQVEEALRESERRFRSLIEQTTDAVFCYECDPPIPTGLPIEKQVRLLYDCTLAECNDVCARSYGATRAEEVIGKKLTDLFGTTPGSLDGLFTALIQGGYRIVDGLGTEILEDGTKRYYLNNGHGVIKNGMLLRVWGTYRDITERKQAEAEREHLLSQIQEQAQRVQQIIYTVPEGVLLLNADGQVILANPVAKKDLVVLSDAKMGETLTHLGDRPLDELLTSPPKGLWHEVAADGRSFQVIARPIEGGPMPGGAGPEPAEGWVLVIRDVTQQREVEQRIRQQERLAAVGQLAAGIAHDFNNIMATVVLYAQMTARMEELPAVVRERMETVNQQAGHATKLIQQILDFSRQAVLERRPLDLAPLLKEHVKLLERTLPESIEIKLDYGLALSSSALLTVNSAAGPDEHAAPLIVNADPTRMQQMVTNLALNARDAMLGGGELRIGLERIEVKPGESPLLPEMEAGDWIKVAVSDTGTGIPPDVLPHIFEPFFTTKAPLGSGLGLSQVYGIVGQHGGRIDVETQAGKGTTFTIYLPMHPSGSSTAASSSELLALATGQGETVLVVEDDTILRKALVESLEMLNYRALEAMNGREALTMLEQHGDDIDLLLSDVIMPEMGGMALLHALREQGLRVPVVMLTGHPLAKEMEELRAQGMADWLPKPPQLEQLAEVVARALGTD